MTRADGRIGPFQIDRTTEAQLRATFGKPTRVVKRSCRAAATTAPSTFAGIGTTRSVVLVRHGKVDMLVYLGPHSIFYEGLC